MPEPDELGWIVIAKRAAICTGCWTSPAKATFP